MYNVSEYLEFEPHIYQLAILASALSVLLTYLAGSSASVLENTLVEKEQVASAVYYSTESRPDTVIQFTLSSVDAATISDVELRFFEVLRNVASEKLDMTYMTDCIRREKRQLKYHAEVSGTFFTDSIINDFLFGNRDGSTLRELESLRVFDELEAWTDPQWKQCLRKWMTDAPHITILGKPSAKLSKKLETEEKARVAAQKERLGEEGLEELGKKLAEAKAENDREIPKQILEQFEVPDTSSIHFIDTTTARSGAARKMGYLDNLIQKIIDRDDYDLPLFIHFEHVQTNFVHISLLMNTGAIPIPLRPLLSIYLENFFSTPILRNGKRIEFEQVIMDLEKDTVDYGIESGTSLGNPEMLRIRFLVEIEKYDTAIRWLRDLLWDGIFDLTVCVGRQSIFHVSNLLTNKRLKATTARLLSDIPEEKRSGNAVSELFP